MTRNKRISLKEIAALAEVSISTVSNVLNDKAGTSTTKRELIKKIARDSGYYRAKAEDKKTHKHIRFLICKRYGIVMDTPFFSVLIEAIENEFKRNGYEMLLSLHDINEANLDDIVNSVNKDSSMALLVLATELDRSDFACFQHLKKPVVFLDCYYDGLEFDFVLINNVDAAYKATSYLIDKGHRDIGYLHGAESISNEKYRKIGYMNALKENGLQFDRKNEYSIGLTIEGANKDMKKLLQRIHDKDLPEAFFADNDNIAISAIKFFTENGVKIPEDVSIIGIDDVAFSAMVNPPLSTIRVPREELGSIAVKRLIEKMNQNDSCMRKIEVSTRLIERGSVLLNNK